MTKVKTLLALVAAIACWAMMQAAPAKPAPFTHVQSDGSTVTLMMRGGEFNHSLMTMDGLTVDRDTDGDYYYTAGGALSNVRAHDASDRGIEEQAFVIAYRDQMTLESPFPSRAPSRGEQRQPSGAHLRVSAHPYYPSQLYRCEIYSQ